MPSRFDQNTTFEQFQIMYEREWPKASNKGPNTDTIKSDYLAAKKVAGAFNNCCAIQVEKIKSGKYAMTIEV